MAVNVYMVFFFSANPNNFLRYWWAYFIVCYGIPLVPSLVLLFAKGDAAGHMYGNATVSSQRLRNDGTCRVPTQYLLLMFIL